MSKEQSRRAETVFYECLERDPASRAAYLDEVCESPEVRAEVESLLEAHEKGERAFRAPESEGPTHDSGSPDATADQQAAGERVEGRTIGRYTLKRLLGRGGFGVVYEAEQRDPRRSVALKVMRGGAYLDDAGVRLFQREARALARLAHPGIAAIYEAGRTDDGEHFFAMELVRGRALMDHVRAADLSLERKLDLFAKICEAIQYAHRRGVMHRDLKPGNILIDREGNAKILDFGLAKITDTDVTLSTVVTEVGRIQGTLPYMSPEQARGEADAIDIRSDVYSLGVILYEMLTGELPYDVDRPMLHEAVRVICEEPPKRPSTISHVVRGDLETIVLKALAKEPERRYDSASALADDIARYRTNQPISARPPSAGYQIRKLVARHKFGFAFAATVLVLLIASGVWLGLLYARAESLRVETAEALAETEIARDESRAATEFLSSMLWSISPEEEGRDVTVREVLDEAAASVHDRFVDSPTIEATLRQTMGNAYRELGEYENSEREILEAHRLQTEALGPNHPLALGSMNNLGYLYTEMGRFEEADSLHALALAGQRIALSEDDPDLHASLQNYGLLEMRKGRLEEAFALIEEAFRLRQTHVGEEDPKTLGSMNSLAILHYRLGRVEKAEEVWKELLAIRERIFPEDHPQVIQSISNLGALHGSLGRHEEARPYFERVLEIRSRDLGDDHPSTLLAKQNLASLHRELGDNERALRLNREILDVRRRVLGREHPETIRTRSEIASALNAMERYAESEPIAREVLATSRRVVPDDVMSVSINAYRYAVALLGLARYDEAEALFIEVHPRFEQTDPTGQWATETCLSLEDLYTRTGREREAAAWRARVPVDDAGENDD